VPLKTVFSAIFSTVLKNIRRSQKAGQNVVFREYSEVGPIMPCWKAAAHPLSQAIGQRFFSLHFVKITLCLSL
jgi:hypothetical protein